MTARAIPQPTAPQGPIVQIPDLPPLETLPGAAAALAWLAGVGKLKAENPDPSLLLTGYYQREHDKWESARRQQFGEISVLYLGPSVLPTDPDERRHLRAYLIENGVSAAELDLALQQINRVGKFRVVLRRPTEELMFRLIANAGLAQIRRPNDLENDGDYEVLECLLAPSRDELLAFLGRRPACSDLLTGALGRLGGYGDNMLIRLPPKVHQQLVAQHVDPKDAEAYGGVDELVSFQIKGHDGAVIIRRLKRLEYKAERHAMREKQVADGGLPGVGTTRHVASTGKSVVLWPDASGIAQLSVTLPGIFFAIGTRVAELAREEVEFDEKK